MIQVVVKFLPLALNAADAAEYVGVPRIFDDMRKAGWIKPLTENHKLVVFDRKAIESAYARFQAGEYPGESR